MIALAAVLLLLRIDSKKKGMFVALSPDDGAIWPHVRMLGGVAGYLSLAQELLNHVS